MLFTFHGVPPGSTPGPLRQAMTTTATAAIGAAPMRHEDARAAARDKYHQNLEQNRAAARLKQERYRAAEAGLTVEAYRVQQARKRAAAIDKKMARALARLMRQHRIKKPAPRRASPSKARPSKAALERNALRDVFTNGAAVFRRRQWRETYWLAALLDPTGPARAAGWRARAELWAAEEKAAAERRAEHQRRLNALMDTYRADFRAGRFAAWPTLDADTYATGRLLGDILETREGRPITLEHHAMRVERSGMLDTTDIERLRELGDPEILRLDRECRERCLRAFGVPTWAEHLQNLIPRRP